MHLTPRKSSRNALVVGLLFVVSACSSAGGTTDGNEDFNTTAEYLAEYQAATVGRDLPAGVAWPPEPPGERTEQYQQGVGVSDADSFWRCAWTEEWLSMLGQDDVRSMAALDTLGEFRQSQLFTVALDDVGRQLFDSGYQSATLGDPTPFQTYASVNCS